MPKCQFKSIEDLPLILTCRDVQAVLGIHNNGVYELMRQPGFPAVRVSQRRIIVPKDMFIKWLSNSADAQLA